MIARQENYYARTNAQSSNRIFIDLRLEIKYEMDLESRGRCRFRVLLDMKNKEIFGKLQEGHGEGYVS
jgi:hypothetical protein